MFGIAAIPSVLLALGMTMCPESPRWLFQVFAWLHSVFMLFCSLYAIFRVTSEMSLTLLS